MIPFKFFFGIPLLVLLLTIHEAKAVVLDYYPVVLISTPTLVAEGAHFDVSISLSTVPGSTCAVTYYTQDESAVAGTDYFPAAGTIMFAQTDSLTKSFSVVTTLDDTFDRNKTFLLVFNNSVGCHMDSQSIEVTILESTPHAVEGLQIDVPISLGGPATAPCYITYSTEEGIAGEGTDYSKATGAVVWNVGETSKTISLSTLVDYELEAIETFYLVINSSFGCPIPSQTIRLFILDYPTTVPVLNVLDASAPENQGGRFSTRFSITISEPQIVPVFVTLKTQPGTATEDVDYEGTTYYGAIDPGQTGFHLLVREFDDSFYEQTEYFYLKVVAVTNAIVGPNSVAVGTIWDNDPMPTLSVLPPQASVNESVGTYSVVVSLNGSTAVGVNVSYAFSGGSAMPGLDFVGSSGWVYFPAPSNFSTLTVPVTIVQDILDEDTETFTFSLLNATDASITNATQTISILDDDPMPNCFFRNPSMTVPEGIGIANIPISLSVPSGKTISFQVSQVPGTASTSDYIPVNTMIVIPAGGIYANIGIPIVQDTIVEPMETFTVMISAPVNCVIAGNSMPVTILDDDH